MPYLTAEQIQCRIKEMADRINKDLAGQDIVFLVVLNGAFIFAADLLRFIEIPAQVSFIRIASYEGLTSTGKEKIIIGLQEKLENKTVVVVEDIVDTGHTLEVLMKQLKACPGCSIKTAALLFKPGSYQTDIEPDYKGFQIPDRFIAGYGLDYNGYGRNLSGLYMLQESSCNMPDN